jgi:biofilm PGA synthesis N-glycosyltransferase PgaC
VTGDQPRGESARVDGNSTSVVTPRQVKYCIITPTRDEEKFIRRTIESVLRQTILPQEWIIVDDGSTDGTASIVDQYVQQHSWIRLLRRVDRGYRATGGGVEPFLAAYPLLTSGDWEFLVNLDGDLIFDNDYFEKCFQYFRQIPALGIGGGTIYNKVANELQLERSPAFHVRGATKIYRRSCWDVLGGLTPGVGWDTVDEIKANHLGWTTRTFDDLRLVHQRPTGDALGVWNNAVKDGESDYLVGYHPIFFWLKCLRLTLERPILLRGLGIAYGFVRGVARRSPRITDESLRRYLRRQQLRRLVGGESIWNQD